MNEQAGNNDLGQFLTDRIIIRRLARLRVAEAAKRHHHQRLAAISATARDPMEAVRPVYTRLFPPRRTWHSHAPHRAARKLCSQKVVLRRSLETAVSRHMTRYPDSTEAWRLALADMIAAVRKLAAAPDPVFDEPVRHIFPKPDGGKRIISAFMNPPQRVLLGLLNQYLSNRLDPFLADCVYAFRTDPALNRTRAVENLEAYRQRYGAGGLHVAECDLVDFFNHIRHSDIRAVFRRHADWVDPQALRVVDACIRASSRGHATGIPQGGALSALIANLVLTPADAAVTSVKHGVPVFYARFCDDIIIAHPDPAICQTAFDRYLDAVAELGLTVHHPVEVGAYGAGYYDTKSKKPFRWADPERAPDAIPWIGFLGYELRHDGLIRVRKRSIEKQRARQQDVIETVRLLVLNTPPSQLRASGPDILNRTAMQLASMSTGRIRERPLDGPATQPCWTDAFELATDNASTRFHYRGLDRSREYQLRRLKRTLIRQGIMPAATPQTERNRASDTDTRDTPGFYLGAPFSYYATLCRGALPPCKTVPDSCGYGL